MTLAFGVRDRAENTVSDGARVFDQGNNAYHDVDDQNSNITQRTSTTPQIAKRFVTRCVDNQETRNLVVKRVVL